MAGVALLLKYQWKAYWRRFFRGGQSLAQVLLLLLSGWLIFIRLPPLLLRAAEELTLGRTERTAEILLVFAFSSLFLLYEDSNLSLTPTPLARFPLSVKQLLAVRILSPFISPVVAVIAIGTLFSLLPLLKARHPMLGIAAALLFLAPAASAWLCLSHLMRISAWRSWFLAAAALIIIPLGASLVGNDSRVSPRLESLLLRPASLVTSVATGVNSETVLIPLSLLAVASALAFPLLLWSFRQSLPAEKNTRSSRAWKIDLIRFYPGRLGGLVGKEQRYFHKTLTPWLCLLFALAAGYGLLRNAIPAIASQTAIVLFFLIGAGLTTNVFGADRARELNRYLIFPLTGRKILVGKNLGLGVIMAAQLAPLLALASWRFGWAEGALEAIEAIVLLLAHLAWGNLRSVYNPYKLEFFQLHSRENVVYALAGAAICSLPGIAVINLNRLDSNYLILKLAALLFLTAVVYLAALRLAGRMIERRWQTIMQRLS